MTELTSTVAREKKLAFTDVLTEIDNSFNNLFDMGLLREMEDAGGIVPKGLKACLEKKDEATRIPRLLGYMKNMKKPVRFIEFLRILERSTRSAETAPKMRENTRRLMVVMSAYVKDMFTYGGDEEEAAIQSFIATAESYITTREGQITKESVKSTQSSAGPSQESIAEAECPSLKPPLTPQRGFSLARCFYREGGTIYSSIHGIEVIIPPDSIPSHIPKFVLSFYVYLRDPFVLPANITPIGPTVWFSLTPYFEFIGDISIRIPHSAVVGGDLDMAVYTTAPSPNPPCVNREAYMLSETVDDCTYDWYYTVVKVRHFSPFRPGARKKADESIKKIPSNPFKHSLKTNTAKTLKDLKKQKSSSIDKECPPDELTTKCRASFGAICSKPNTDTLVDAMACVQMEPSTVPSPQVQASSVNSYWIARESTRNRSGIPWSEKFHVVHNHPSYVWEKIINFVENKESELLSPKVFHFVQNSLQFSCRDVSDGWSVVPTDGEEIIVEDLEGQSFLLKSRSLDTAIKTGAYPSTVTYEVDSNQSGARHNPLKCVISITGANRKLEYTLTSTQHTNKGPSSFTTIADLYNPDGQLVRDLASGRWRKLCLDMEIADHIVLITDISIQLPCPETLSKMLQIDETQFERIVCDYSGSTAEQVFQLLYSWVCDHPTLTLEEICSSLGICNIAIIPNIQTSQIATNPRMKTVALGDVLFAITAICLQASWKFVARFFGFSADSITGLTRDHPHSCAEQAYQMLKKWHMNQGEEATYGHLFTAIRRLWSYDSIRADIHSAYLCFIKYDHFMQS